MEVEVRELGPERESLARFTVKQRTRPAISWYRTPVPSESLKALHERNDLRGAAQTLGFLGCYILTLCLALYSFSHWSGWITACLVFQHGMIAAFMINAVHELGHGTVFRTRWLNDFFAPVFAFLGWTNHLAFAASHTRHHRYTLHPPDDLEVVLPMKLVFRDILKHGIVDVSLFRKIMAETWRLARGRFRGEWEATLYPENEPQLRVRPVRWARILLLGHGLILAVSLWQGWWLLPVLTSLSTFYGGWLFFLCNHTQHIGLEHDTPDYRLCCRTFTLNPFVAFLYWHMNYHTEHHMYPGVPCYSLHRLHAIIRHDLPRCAHGLVAVWREIAELQQKQKPESPEPAHLPA